METVSSSPPDRTINYAFILGGVTALIFGIILLVRQDEALSLLMVILGLWWLIQGAFMIFAVFVDRTDMWWKLIIGVLGVVAGFLVLTNPGEAADVFQGVIGVVLGIIGIVVGVTAIIGSFRGGGIGAFVFGGSQRPHRPSRPAQRPVLHRAPDNPVRRPPPDRRRGRRLPGHQEPCCRASRIVTPCNGHFYRPKGSR